jgi:uncharacterized iron-regulated membrane protein
METVSMTLTPPIRVAAFVGALVATGLVAFVFIMGRGASENEASAPAKPVTKPSAQTSTPPKVSQTTPKAKPRVVVTKSGFPVPVDRALRRRGVVVVAVYMPGAAVDAVVRAEARAAAIRSRAGYVAVSALNERLVRSLVARTGVLPDPAVLIVKRPGVVTATLSVTDRETISQAVAQARR